MSRKFFPAQIEDRANWSIEEYEKRGVFIPVFMGKYYVFDENHDDEFEDEEDGDSYSIIDKCKYQSAIHHSHNLADAQRLVNSLIKNLLIQQEVTPTRIHKYI